MTRSAESKCKKRSGKRKQTKTDSWGGTDIPSGKKVQVTTREGKPYYCASGAVKPGMLIRKHLREGDVGH